MPRKLRAFAQMSRVANLSLLNMDWYIDQMKRKAYDSDPVPFSMTWERYHQGNHDVTYLIEDPSFKDQYVDIRQLFNIINTDERQLKMSPGRGMGTIDFFPTRKFLLPFRYC